MGVIPGGSRPVPDGALPLSGLNALRSYTEDYVKARARGEVANIVAPAKNQFFQNIMGGFNTVPDAVEVVEGAVNERIDLLDGIRGYVAGYQRWNENLANAPGNRRRVSLDQHGVAKGARIEGGSLFFDEPGLWTVHAQFFANKTSYTAGLASDDITKLFIIMREYNPFKATTVKEVYGVGGKGPHNVQTSFTLVVPSANTSLDFEVFSDRWRKFLGGTAYTSVSAVKNDNRIDNPGELTVPDA